MNKETRPMDTNTCWANPDHKIPADAIYCHVCSKPIKFGERYIVLKELGFGGFGDVYLVNDITLSRQVALKKMKPGTSPEIRAVFIQEAKTLSTLNHSNIVPIYDSSPEEFYFVMQYIPGGSLRSRISRNTISIDDVINFTMEIMQALHFAHSHNVVHRDLKPENILINENNSIVICDFGLAKIFSSKIPLHTVGGTIGYMAPEIFSGDPYDHQCDIFSAGVVAYEMISGVLPYHGKTLFEYQRSTLNASVNPLEKYKPDLPYGISDLIMRMITPSKSRRPQTAASVIKELKAISKSFEKIALFDEFQTMLNGIYSNNNSKRGEDAILGLFILHAATITGFSDDQETGRPLLIKKAIAQAMAWGMGYCHSVLKENISSIIFGKYNFSCPYCKQSQCQCGDHKEGEELFWSDPGKMNCEIYSVQEMFSNIYSKKNSKYSIEDLYNRLIREIFELIEIHFKLSPSDEKQLRLRSETADIFARIFAIATRLDVDVFTSLNIEYPGYCKRCEKHICHCPLDLQTLSYRAPGLLS